MPEEDQLLELARNLRKRDPEKAAKLLQDFLEREPSSNRAKLLLASFLVMGYGDAEEGARRLYTDVIRSDPDNASALNGLALLSGTTGEESIRLLQRATQVAKRTDLLMNLSYKLWELERFDEAARAFEQVLHLAEGEGRASLVPALERAIASVRRRESPEVTPYSFGDP